MIVWVEDSVGVTEESVGMNRKSLGLMEGTSDGTEGNKVCWWETKGA